jgi:hypothetical protein
MSFFYAVFDGVLCRCSAIDGNEQRAVTLGGHSYFSPHVAG